MKERRTWKRRNPNWKKLFRFNKIPPQKQLDIRMRKKIIVCEYCGRIMIDPELAGVIAEQHLETVKR